MMGRWPLNRRETFQMVGWMVILLGALPRWVDLFEKLGVEVARLVPYLELLQRARWVIVAVAALGLLVMLAPRFRAALARWEWGRQRYVRALAWLARPVRDELAAMLLDDGDASNGGFDEELRQRIGGLSIQALGSLRGLLRAYRPGCGREFRVGPQPEDEGGMGLNCDQRLARIALACAELEEAGFISEQRLSADGEKVEGYLAPCVRPGLVLRLLDWVEEELEARGARMSP